MSQNFREMTNTQTHQTGVYLLGSCFMYMNVHPRKLYYLKTKIEACVYLYMPHQENVVSQLIKEESWHMQELGVATWNSEKQLGRCFILWAVSKHTCQRQVFIRTVKCAAICI